MPTFIQNHKKQYLFHIQSSFQNLGYKSADSFLFFLPKYNGLNMQRVSLTAIIISWKEKTLFSRLMGGNQTAGKSIF